jgi:uncharacterized membrane protein YphA (DoxX/SURF4 family)
MFLLQTAWLGSLSETAILSAQVLLAAFFAILFLQSGVDKVGDRKGNLEWMKGHFAKSPLASLVPLLLTVVTLTEILAGVLSAMGVVFLLVGGSKSWALLGVQVSALNLLMLFLGQRLAKDYEGAATLTGYFLLSVFGIFLLS